MSAPIFRDPVADGAADPTVIRKDGTDGWWMFYANRQPAAEGPLFTWIHGSPIGVAVSTDDGASWQYRDTVKGLDAPGDVVGGNTHWAPEVIFAEGQYHMWLSYIPGVAVLFHPSRVGRAEPDRRSARCRGAQDGSASRPADGGGRCAGVRARYCGGDGNVAGLVTY